tara:strand:+ start:9974 stop:10381 length:408 start_codon:yes stop_codon:yes gene_type:complete
MSAQGLSVALPLRIDARDGAYGLNKNLQQVAEQNLKMVILTAPGERIMFPEFGVGVRNFLFEQSTPSLNAGVRQRIEQQVKKYLPYIQILELSVNNPEVQFAQPGTTDNTTMLIKIKYSVPAASLVADLTIPVSS